MKRSPSQDYQESIGQSLKRVKISTSPGELRLNSDLELLLTSKQWTPTGVENSPPGRMNELSSQNARLMRDPVDPLRLRLMILHRPGVSTASERWTFFLQMPRMYPHLPPVVTRVTKEKMGDSLSATSTMVAVSIMQRGEVPVPEKVLIKALPPGSGADMEDEEEMWAIDAATSVYRQWSPVSSLTELIDFLMGIPERRREWWAIESNRRSHLQNLGVYSMGNSYPSQPSVHPTVAPQYGPMMMEYPLKPASPNRYHKAAYPSSPCDMEAETESQGMEGSPFVANRFDVGYERGAIGRHWGVR